LRDGHTRQQRELFCAADGVPMTLEMQALPIAAPDEAADPAVPVAYVVLHVVDVTEKLQLEALMLENERLEMGRKLTQLFAHEVNTPLQTILLSLEHLPTADDEERSWFVSLMRQEIQRIGALLHQFAHVYQDDADEQASDDEDQPDEYD
jgi:signal transduction histidine kinase